jgi:hypothetical protein
MGWEMPWYSAQDSLDTLLVGRRVGMMHIVCYLRQGSNVFETYWTTIRGVEAMDNNYRLLDLTVYGRQERWEDSPAGWPQGDIMDTLRTDGRPTAQWSRLTAGYSDDLDTSQSWSATRAWSCSVERQAGEFVQASRPARVSRMRSHRRSDRRLWRATQPSSYRMSRRCRGTVPDGSGRIVGNPYFTE